MMQPAEQLIIGGLFMAAVMLIVWLYQLRSQDAGIVDIAWSGGLGALAIFYALTSDGYLLRRILLAVLAGLWSFRLFLYLYQRNRNRPEDGRYQSLRQRWGSRVQPFFLVFFQAQALLDVIFSLPFLVVAHHSRIGLGWNDWMGVLLWMASVVGESIADRQLERFRSDPANGGRTCREGLWRYSRHPNYFFEWLHWWSYVMIAWGADYWGVTFVGPVLMLFFLFKVTGIPATEEQALKSREDYRLYQQTTSVFVPWFPRLKAHENAH